MSTTSVSTQARLFPALLAAAGVLCGLGAALFNQWLLALLDPRPPLGPAVTRAIHRSQAGFLAVGLLLLGMALALGKVRQLRPLAASERLANVTLAMLALLLPLLTMELVLQPLAVNSSKTVIFERDPELGWRMRPDSQDLWGGVPVTVNAKGLRGPEVPYDRTPGALRILYLGDSVAFGHGLERAEDAFPYQVEAILEQRLSRQVETVNAAVGGYATWQQAAYLEQEGAKYAPDLIVVAFVLNDAVDKVGLEGYQGTGAGWELDHTTNSTMERLLSRSGIVFLASRLAARLRFGQDLEQGAQAQELSAVEVLARFPDQADVQRAWQVTLADLNRIYEFGRQRQIPVVLVVFPYVFQFESSAFLSTPQEIVSQHASEQAVPVLDLLPLLQERLALDQASPATYFLDADHLSEAGSTVVGDLVAQYLLELPLLKGTSAEAPGRMP